MFNKNQYSSAYTKENYDRVLVLVPKGRKADIKKLAEQKGITTTQLVIRALESCYGLDLSK